MTTNWHILEAHAPLTIPLPLEGGSSVDLAVAPGAVLWPRADAAAADFARLFGPELHPRSALRGDVQEAQIPTWAVGSYDEVAGSLQADYYLPVAGMKQTVAEAWGGTAGAHRCVDGIYRLLAERWPTDRDLAGLALDEGLQRMSEGHYLGSPTLAAFQRSVIRMMEQQFKWAERGGHGATWFRVSDSAGQAINIYLHELYATDRKLLKPTIQAVVAACVLDLQHEPRSNPLDPIRDILLRGHCLVEQRGVIEVAAISSMERSFSDRLRGLADALLAAVGALSLGVQWIRDYRL